jgi:Cu/Ag efflux protein CusF
MGRVGKIVVACLASVLVAGTGVAQEVFSYHVKGVVKALPGAGTASNEIMVKHEPIPDYRDEAGNVVGMAAMTMPFYLSKKIALDSIGVGDRVEMVVEQRLKPRFTEEVVSIHKIK